MRQTLGINAHLPGPPALDLAQALGVGSIRVDANWNMLQPTPDRWDWALLDQVVYGARKRNLEVFATIGYTPNWLSAGQGRQTPPPVYDWEIFVRTIAERYRHNVWHFGIWNEPNQPGMYAGGVEQYVDQVLIPAAKILHAIGPENRVAAPDLMTEGDEWPRWLKTCLSRARAHIDVISVHSYQDTGREVWRALSQGRRWWEVWKKPSVRQVIQDAGCGDKPVWLTETGWEATDAASEAAQANAVDQLLEALSGNPWVERVYYFQLLDEPTETRGVYRQDGSPKPAVSVFKKYCQVGVV